VTGARSADARTGGRGAEQRLMAALLRAGPEACAGGPSACWLHGLEGFGPDWQPWVLVPPARKVQRASFTIARAGWNARDERTVRCVPTVSPQLALIDAAALVTEKRTRVAVDSGRRLGLLRVDRLAERANEAGGRRGAAVVRRICASGQLGQDGEGERLMARLFRRGDPQPRWGVWIYRDAQVDALFPEARLAVEFDGKIHHSIDADPDHDSRRELRLKRDGIEVIRITCSMLRDTPEQTRRMVLEMYGQRMALGLPPVVPIRFGQWP
jgi:hypothetical protein